MFFWMMMMMMMMMMIIVTTMSKFLSLSYYVYKLCNDLIIACKCALSISATGCLCKDVHVVIQESIFQEVTGLTDLDKLYLALVELDKKNYFNTLCFGLGVNSLEKLADFSLKSETQLITSQTLADIKREIDSKHFNFHELVQV